MRPKLFGIGKCGSRIVFDFSAYTYSHPPAFELRNSNLQTVDQIVGVMERIQRYGRKLLDKAFSPSITPVRLYTTYSSVTIDSDLEGNEVTKLQAAIAEQRHAARPIETALKLGRRVGGCEYGLISEAFARPWLLSKEKPLGLDIDTESEKFALVATSLGGGTGSGSSSVLAWWLASEYNTHLRPFHVSIVGILPMSDLDYGDLLRPVWDFGDQVNTGRAIAVFLKQSAEAARGQIAPGLWVVSNDLLRAGSEKGVDDSLQPINDRSISVVNYHVATVACFLSNIAGAPAVSSDNRTRQYVTVEANFDAAEMNNHLSGNIYFTGYSSEDAKSDLFLQDKKGTLFARALLRRALDPLDLGYTFDRDSAPRGCSLPFRADEWNPEDLEAWCQAEGSQGPVHLPVELRTARWVGVLHGQPEEHRSASRRIALKQALGEIFPAADIQVYPFYHRFDTSEHLCLFVAGSFSRVIYLALVGYCRACFDADDGFLAALDNIFRSGSAAEIDTLIKDLHETEAYPRTRFGTEAEEFSTSRSPSDEGPHIPSSSRGLQQSSGDLPRPRLVTRENLSIAFRSLHESYRRPIKARNSTTL